MKHLFLCWCLFLLLGSSVASAQTRKAVKPFEFEFSLGLSVPFDTPPELNFNPGFTWGLEGRTNIKNTPFDIGFASHGSLNIPTIKYINEEKTLNDFLASSSVMLVGDYNFRQGYKVNPYIGIGAGINLQSSISSILDTRITPMLMPRVGVELGHHFRVGAYLKLLPESFSSAGFTLSVVFGGGRVKPIKVKDIND